MRFWVLLLAVYVLVLSGVPCEALCQDEPIAATGQGAPAPAGQQQDCKMCSPFSVCAACPGFTMPAPVRVQRVAVRLLPAVLVQVSQYRPPHTLEVAARIWQPPRVG